jgi:hypothetical protein
VLLVEEELLTLPEHLSSPPDFSGVRAIRSFVVYVCFVDRFFVLYLLAIVLFVLRYTDSDCPFGIFKLFLLQECGIYLVFIWSLELCQTNSLSC